MSQQANNTRLILDRPEFHVWLDEIQEGVHWETPCLGREFALLVYGEAGVVDCAKMNSLCRTFVTAGCRYAVCVGGDANAWERAFDDAYLMPTGVFDPDYVPSEDKFLMTTAHEEPVPDVVEFLFNSACTTDWVPEYFVIAIVGKNEQARQQLLASVWDHLGNEDQYRVKQLLREVRSKVEKQ